MYISTEKAFNKCLFYLKLMQMNTTACNEFYLLYEYNIQYLLKQCLKGHDSTHNTHFRGRVRDC